MLSFKRLENVYFTLAHKISFVNYKKSPLASRYKGGIVNLLHHSLIFEWYATFQKTYDYMAFLSDSFWGS
jgi:hypothetical protein